MAAPRGDIESWISSEQEPQSVGHAVLAQRAPHLLRRDRDVDVEDAEGPHRVNDRVGDRRRHAGGGRLPPLSLSQGVRNFTPPPVRRRLGQSIEVSGALPGCPEVATASRRSPPDAGRVSGHALGRPRRRPVPAERVGGRVGYEASSNQNSACGGSRAGAKVARGAREPERREHCARHGGVHDDGDHAATPAARAMEDVLGEYAA